MADDTRLPAQTPSPADERLRELRRLLPEAFVEGKLDVEKLRAAVGDDSLVTGRERYGLSWAGKADAVRTLLAPGTGTLRPCPAESVNFDSTENLIIEGDNLEVLKLLQKGYHGKVKLIYIDPPYNTGNDFIYADDFRSTLAAYRRYTGEIDEAGNATTSNRDSSGRFHSNWLNMMYPRLHLARNLLREDGVIFVSIDDNEVHNLCLLMEEIFGGENHIATICWKNVTDNNPTLINVDHEYVVCFAKTKGNLPQSWKSSESDAKSTLTDFYESCRLRGMTTDEIQSAVRGFIADNEESMGFLTRYKHVDNAGVYTGSESVHNTKPGGYNFEILHPETRKPMRKPANGYRFPEETFKEMNHKGVILYGADENRIIKIKKYLAEYEDTFRSVISMDGRLGSYDLMRLFDNKLFNNPKPVDLLKSFVSFSTGKHDLILDFFGGSGTTAHAVLDMNEADGGNRKFILVQLPEKTEKPDYPTIADITRERVRRVIKRIEQQRAEKIAGADLITEEKGPAQILGFRALRLADSNFRTWDPERASAEPAELAKQLELHADNLVAGRDELDRLFELLLRAGLPLSANLSQMDAAGQPAWIVCESDQMHVFCLASPIHAATLDAIRAAAPDTVVCLDAAFAGDDALKTNTVLQMKDAGISFHTA